MASMSSKEAAAYLIDPMNAPEPSAETGPGTSHRQPIVQSIEPQTRSPTTSHRDSVGSNNPFRSSMTPPPGKSGVRTSSRPVSQSGSKFRFPDHRDEAFGSHSGPRRSSELPPSYDSATSPNHSPKVSGHHRRTSSLKERFPGDESHKPLDIIRKDSKRAARSPHLAKRHIPGADSIDKLDPAFGGLSYHHEGPYDAALLARNTSYDSSPVAALKTTNDEALKATPAENIKDALERHKPLDGVAIVPPGTSDRFGRTYEYEEGTDMLRENVNGEPGFKRWADKDYDAEDVDGVAEPTFSLNRALQAHKIDDNGIEMEDHAKLRRDYHDAEHNGTLDTRDPVEIAGGQVKYVDLEAKHDHDYNSNTNRASGLRLAGEGLKKRFNSLRKKNRDD